jgi:alcohol dehydrogenase, propanol-preferring
VPTMPAFRLLEWGRAPELVDVAVPTVGTGEVLLKMAGVGLCHTDLHFLEAGPNVYPYEVPFTLGHENGGWVEQLGADVDDLAVGDAGVVAGIHSCGRCGYCLRGHDNYCAQGWRGRGYGQDGGLATYLVVPRRELVPLTTLDPRLVGPLSDAGATSYHAIRKVLGKLVPGSTALVIGAGGLGGYAIQFLRRLTGARVIAVDIAENRLDVARDLGAHETLLSDEGTAQAVRALTGGEGAHVVLDFVGTDATMPMALAAARTMGAVAFVGAGGGTARVGWGAAPLECDVFVPMAATISDLYDVVALAETGDIRIDVELFPLERAAEAYEAFRSGDLRGRAVVTPNG